MRRRENKEKYRKYRDEDGIPRKKPEPSRDEKYKKKYPKKSKKREKESKPRYQPVSKNRDMRRDYQKEDNLQGIDKQ